MVQTLGIEFFILFHITWANTQPKSLVKKVICHKSLIYLL